MTESSSPPPAPSKYPNRIQFLILFILVPMLWNGFRFIETLVFWKTLQEFNARPGPLYGSVSSAIWFVYGIVLLVGAWQRKAWAWYATLGAAAGYTVWVWADRLFLQQPHANWPFGITVTLTCLSFVIIILFTPKTKEYFRLGKGHHAHK
jgi:hypothetical protein